MIPITVAAASELADAFALSLRHISADVRAQRVEQCLALVAAGEIDPAGVFVARKRSLVVGAIVCVPLAGASGLFWPPQTRPSDAGLADRLVDVALAWIRSRGAKIAQAIVQPDEAALAAPLVRRGFHRVTRLRYLTHALENVPPGVAANLRFHSYARCDQEQFHQTLLKTYEGTLDCPELSDVRTIDEVIAGHKAQGLFDPERWWLAYRGNSRVGLVLLTQVPDSAAWDMSYLGIVPSARGKGLGRALAIHAMHAAQAARAERLILAVDERNTPALQLYQSLGFESVEEREVYLLLQDRPLAGMPGTTRTDQDS